MAIVHSKLMSKYINWRFSFKEFLNSRNENKSTRFYSSIFMTLTLSIVFTIFILSAILNLNSENVVRKLIFSYTLSNLSQTREQAALMTVTAETFAKQMYNDIHVSKILNYTSADYVDIITALNQLNYYRGTSPFIDSIYIYNSKAGTFYISADVGSNQIQNEANFYDQEIVKIVKNYWQYPYLKPIPRKITVKYPKEQEIDVYTFILYNSLNHSSNNDIIVVNISSTQLHKNIDGMITGSSNNSFMINDKGILVSNSWTQPMLTDLSNKEYIRKILKNNSDGYFVAEVDNVKSFIAYSSIDFLGWRYIRIVPYISLTKEIYSMKVMTVLIAVIILLIGTLISYLISKKIFLKVDKKLLKLQALELEKSSNLQKLRQEYLRNILLGEEKLDLNIVNEYIISYDMNININNNFRVILLKIDNYKNFTIKYDNEDRNLLKYAIMNIAYEIISKENPLQLVDMNEDRIAILLDISESTASLTENNYKGLMKNVQNTVFCLLKISVSVTISSIGNSIQAVAQLYNEAIENSFYRLFYGHNSIIDETIVSKANSNQYIYPENKEKQLIEDLMLGKIENAKYLLKEILCLNAEYQYTSYFLAVSHLSFTISNTLNIIQKNNLPSFQLSFNSLLMNINNAETLQEVYERFYEIFDSVSLKLEEKKDSKYDDMVLKIIDIINKEYMDQNLSLDSIASSLGMTATYIGRLYKKYTTKTILDSIIEVRMCKARELLLETDYAVAVIAEKTGFNNSPYFYKAFKKINGVSPAEYRKTLRNLSIE